MNLVTSGPNFPIATDDVLLPLAMFICEIGTQTWLDLDTECEARREAEDLPKTPK
jgi:hypothetical protein